MAKSIGLLLAVVAIWVTVEIYSQGMDGAFGGRLASMGLVEESATPRGPATERARNAVDRAHAAQQERYDELLPD